MTVLSNFSTGRYSKQLSLLLSKIMKVSVNRYLFGGRCGGLMVTAFDSSLSGPGLSPGWGHCVVLLGKTLYSHSASFHPGV